MAALILFDIPHRTLLNGPAKALATLLFHSAGTTHTPHSIPISVSADIQNCRSIARIPPHFSVFKVAFFIEKSCQ
jgi:hypothetical protein